jgi:hypothetical protein
MYEDPNLASAWAVLDPDTKADIEALLFDSSTSATDKSSTTSSSGLSKMLRRATTITMPSFSKLAEREAEDDENEDVENEDDETEESDKKQNQKAEDLERQRKDKQIADLKKKLDEAQHQQKDGTSFADQAGRQDCGFGPLTAKTWKDSGAHAALKDEMDTWKSKDDGNSFHAYMFETYALGLARSMGHCSVFCSHYWRCLGVLLTLY